MANKYVSAAGGNWSTSGTWVTTDGGSTVTTTPTTSDVCYVTGNSGALSLDNTTNTCGSIYFTGYTNTLSTTSASNILTIVTHLTLGSGMSFGATGARIKMTTGAGTYTSNGVTLPWDWEFASATGTKTLADNWTVTGCVYMSANATVNGNKIYAQGGFQSTTTNQRTMYGTTEWWLQGGTWYATSKRTAGKIVLDGAVTVSGGTNNISSPGVYDSTLEYNSGSPTFSGAIFAAGTSTVKLGSSCHIDDFDLAGTITLSDDVYVDGTIQVAGTTSVVLAASGGNRVIYVAESLVMYNQGTYINADGSVKIVMTGTGRLFKSTSLNGMSYAPVSALQIDVDINTSGTITFADNSYNCKFSGGRNFKHINGTVNFHNTSVALQVTGSFNFDINSGFTVQTMQVDAGGVATFVSAATITTLNIASTGIVYAQGNITSTTLRIDGSGAYYQNNGLSTTVETNLYLSGSDSLQPVISASPITVSDFVTSLSTNLSTGASGSTYKRASFTATGGMTDFTIAFDYIHIGASSGTILAQTGGDGYLWIPSGYVYRFYFYFDTSNGYYVNHGMSVDSKWHRIVFTKSLGSALKCYVDGVSKSVSTVGTAPTNGDYNFPGFNYQAQGDVLCFSGTAVDADWVAADYASFQANGNSSAGLYDNTESGLTHGWHVDSWTHAVTNMSLVYNGVSDNQKVFRGDIRFVNVTGIPLKSYFGTVTDCDNAYAPDWDNIKTMAYASAG